MLLLLFRENGKNLGHLRVTISLSRNPPLVLPPPLGRKLQESTVSPLSLRLTVTFAAPAHERCSGDLLLFQSRVILLCDIFISLVSLKAVIFI